MITTNIQTEFQKLHNVLTRFKADLRQIAQGSAKVWRKCGNRAQKGLCQFAS